MISNAVHEAKKNRLRKVRNVIIFSAIITSLALGLGILTSNFGRTYQNARNDVIELSKNSSIQNAESIEMFFARHEDVLLATAEILEYSLSNDELENADIKTMLYKLSEAYNENIYKRYTDENFTGIYASVNGSLIHAYKEDTDLTIPNYDPTERPWYKEGIAGGGKVVFGEPYYDVYDPEVQVMTVTKMLSDGTTVIGMDITLKDMQYAGGSIDVSVTLNGESHDYGHGFILTDRGVVMAHWDPNEQGENYSDPSSPMYNTFFKIEECVNSNKDYFEADIDDVHFGIFPQRLNNGWYMVTLTDFEDIRTTISDFAKKILSGIAVIILIGAVYCFFILRAYIRAEKLSEKLRGALTSARSDALTGFGNRAAYDMRIRELKEKTAKDDLPFALIMMDLNDLKHINDYHGHASGDQYIVNCCNLVRSIFSCEIYRIGGDEFALFLTDEEFDNWENLFDTLKQSVAKANMSITPNVDKPSIAIGMAIHTVGTDDIEAMLRKADAEMYTNKVAIKQDRLEHSEKGYTEDLKLKVLDKQMLASEMRKGLDEEQFEVWFQPQVNQENYGALIGAEALVRWRHPTRGMVSPGIFIPLFEYNGLIYELDKYVWKHACSCVRQWIDAGMSALPVSVNVSRLDIIQEDFIDTIISYVEEYGIPYDLLHLEITESAFSDDTGKVAEITKDLISRGFVIAIDDFGSGFSSLSLLRNVPAHIIKLDMRFFADGENQARNECIIESIIRMAKMLGMAVLAEGVEKAEQAILLRALGCAYVQGYLYSEPLPYNDYVKYTKATANEIIGHSDGKVNATLKIETAQSQKLFHNIIAGTNDVIIVADNKTRQLLYANRAAEEYFGKRFDPLHPTTCMQFCEKGEICENCPARDIKSGEKREFVSSEDGRHIKSLYTQMDWNGHDAIVLYQTDISAEMREIEYAKSIMNSLGIGIVVFRGETPNELIPVFCNKEYLTLSGLTEEEFKVLLTKSSLYGVHPDDIGEARSKFAESFINGQPMQCHIRVRKADGGYEWVSVYAKIRHLEPSGFEVYMIFADAQEVMKNRLLESERYEKHIVRISNSTARALSVIHINLTKNICHSIHRDICVNRPAMLDKSVDDFLSSVMNNVAKDDAREEFVNRFSASTLRENFESGLFMDEMRLPIRLADQRIIWCNQSVNISRNPTTGDLEAVMSLTEDDKDIRLAEYYKWLIDDAYEFVGNIDVRTEIISVVNESKNRGLADIGIGAVPYMKNLVSRMNALVDSEYVDACIEAMDFSTILEKLKEMSIYTCSFPAKESVLGYKGAFRWSFRFVDEAKTEILFSRRELKGLAVFR